MLQPDINRCGGFTEIRRIAELADAPRRVGGAARLEDRHHRRGRPPLPCRHRQLADVRVPLAAALGLADPDQLVHPEPSIEDGRMPLPVGPGLGIELDDDAVERFRVDRHGG